MTQQTYDAPYVSLNKKLSYRRETARQLRWLTDMQCTEHRRIAEVVLFFDIQTLWFKKCWPKTQFVMK